MKTEAQRRKRRAHRFGLAAEWLCAAHLSCKGYRVLALRLRTAAGEIDLLARRGATLVIVEVKARRDVAHALESVDPIKQRRLAAAANAVLVHPKFACLARLPDLTMRFDVMAVRPWRMPVHIADAWRPEP